MTLPEKSMSNEVEVITQLFDAINRNDIAAAAQLFAPDIERTEPTGFPTAGIYRGIESVRKHLAEGRGTWAEGSCDPDAFFQNGDKVVAHLVVHVRKHGETRWIGGRFADGFVVRDGKVHEYITFAERAEAMAWAGIEL